MSEMIDRMAKIIAAAIERLESEGQLELRATADFSCKPIARAAIEAMRQPTINMVAAGQDVVWKGGARPGPVTIQVTTATFGQIFEAMICAALDD